MKMLRLPWAEGRAPILERTVRLAPGVCNLGRDTRPGSGWVGFRNYFRAHTHTCIIHIHGCYTHTCIYTLHRHTYYIHTFVPNHKHTHTHVHRHTCIIYMHVHLDTNTYTHTHAQMHMHYVHMCTLTYVYIRLYTYTDTHAFCTCICVHLYTNTHIHTCIHTCIIHIRGVYTQTYIYGHTHYIYMYVYPQTRMYTCVYRHTHFLFLPELLLAIIRPRLAQPPCHQHLHSPTHHLTPHRRPPWVPRSHTSQ